MSRSENAKPKLVLPAGLQLALGESGLSIAHDGDVEIHGPLDLRIARLEGSSIVLHGNFEIAHVQSSGPVDVRGTLKATQLTADGDVSLREGGYITSLNAGGTVSLSGTFTIGALQAAGDVQLTGDGSTSAVNGGGSVTLSGSQRHQLVEASDTLAVEGVQEAQLLRGGVVHIGQGSLNAKGIEGRRQVVLGPAKLGVEAVIAPEVNVNAGTTGRVNVVESHNELGPNGLKGGFRLSEYAEFTGVDPAAFLRERGVRSLADLGAATKPAAPVPAAAVEAPPAPEEAPTQAAPVEVEAEEDEPIELTPVEAVPVEAVPVEAVPVEAVPVEAVPVEAVPVEAAAIEIIEEDEEIEVLAAAPADEDEHAPAAVSVSPAAEPMPIRVTPMEVAQRSMSSDNSPTVVEIDDEEELEELEDLEADGPDVSPEVREALNSAVSAVSSSYAGVEEPEAIARLRELVQGADFLTLQEEIKDIWKDLIQHHQQRGKRIPHKVTATFNRINSIVRKL